MGLDAAAGENNISIEESNRQLRQARRREEEAYGLLVGTRRKYARTDRFMEHARKMAEQVRVGQKDARRKAEQARQRAEDARRKELPRHRYTTETRRWAGEAQRLAPELLRWEGEAQRMQTEARTLANLMQTQRAEMVGWKAEGLKWQRALTRLAEQEAWDAVSTANYKDDPVPGIGHAAGWDGLAQPTVESVPFPSGDTGLSTSWDRLGRPATGGRPESFGNTDPLRNRERLARSAPEGGAVPSGGTGLSTSWNRLDQLASGGEPESSYNVDPLSGLDRLSRSTPEGGAVPLGNTGLSTSLDRLGQSATGGGPDPLVITNGATVTLKLMLDKMKHIPGQVPRLTKDVGSNYLLVFDTMRPGDTVVRHEGVAVLLVESPVPEELYGATLDVNATLEGIQLIISH